MDYNRERNNDEVYSKAVRAGKRTYFFDIKSTRAEDLYITITESKRRLEEGAGYEKHKIFLYKEDFEKFKEGLLEVIQKIDEMNSGNYNTEENNLSDFDFDSL
jgi:hypothetical protein